MTQRQRLKQAIPLGERLAQRANQLRAKAMAMPRIEREPIMRKVRQLDIALHINEWLTSPGLQPPK